MFKYYGCFKYYGRCSYVCYTTISTLLEKKTNKFLKDYYIKLKILNWLIDLLTILINFCMT